MGRKRSTWLLGISLVLWSACPRFLFSLAPPSQSDASPKKMPAATDPAAKTKAKEEWKGNIPDVAKDPAAWRRLIRWYFGHHGEMEAMFCSMRMIRLFGDMATKEFAYKVMVALVDRGYPYSLEPYFLSADLDIDARTLFGQNYFFYKGLASEHRGYRRWADFYYRKLRTAAFPKYILLQGVRSYQSSKDKEAIQKLRQILLSLSRYRPRPPKVFVKKVLRTLARIYFEEGQYHQSLDIYIHSLLKMDPLTASDYLEAAWNLYYLGKFERALGLLWNLEAPPLNEKSLFIEKYALRGLIYKKFCDTQALAALLREFEQQFGVPLHGIEHGVPLLKIRGLADLARDQGDKYGEILQTLDDLKMQRLFHARQIPTNLSALSNYFYETEIAKLTQEKNVYESEALEQTASQLVMIHEDLRLLNFEAEQTKLSQAIQRSLASDVKNKNSSPLHLHKDGTRIHWRQQGDFWQDERLNYAAEVSDHCGGQP